MMMMMPPSCSDGGLTPISEAVTDVDASVAAERLSSGRVGPELMLLLEEGGSSRRSTAEPGLSPATSPETEELAGHDGRVRILGC